MVILLRLIPARAGNTSVSYFVANEWTAHPRSRGEHERVHDAVPVVFGSSPLARGTHEAKYAPGTNARLIPARAGNTCYSAKEPISNAAHPRSRGEHRADTTRCEVSPGSSPLARGTRADNLAECFDRRLIPARAGNTHRKHPKRRRLRLIPARAGNTP